jgi:hypothetical protein
MRALQEAAMRETSRAAYARNKEILTARRWEVYAALYDFGPATRSELMPHVSKKAADDMSPRLAELRGQGVVREVGTRPCRVTGTRVIEWDVTKNVAVPVAKLKTHHGYMVLHNDRPYTDDEGRFHIYAKDPTGDGEFRAVRVSIREMRDKPDGPEPTPEPPPDECPDCGSHKIIEEIQPQLFDVLTSERWWVCRVCLAAWGGPDGAQK